MKRSINASHTEDFTAQENQNLQVTKPNLLMEVLDLQLLLFLNPMCLVVS